MRTIDEIRADHALKLEALQIMEGDLAIARAEVRDAEACIEQCESELQDLRLELAEARNASVAP